MARKIPFSEIGQYLDDRADKLMRVAVLETDKRLKLESPVDTGRFRVSWQVGENAAPGGQKPPGEYSGNAPIERLNYDKEKIGNIYSIHNNLPYAEPLANGSSGQAPAGWVQGIAKDIQGFVVANAAKLGRGRYG
jgi:hypothetical protein